MDIAVADPRIWRLEELAAILHHQLSAPVEFDLGTVEEGAGQRLTMLTCGEGLLLRSFADLLHHPHPPVELLQLTKQFAKACWQHPDSPLPAEVAMLLYFASIAVALARCGQRITSLGDEALRPVFDWFARQPWVDEATRSLLSEGLGALVPLESIAPGAERT
jgi:hypothetical protein